MSDKVEKKLPAEILSLIDEEAVNLNITRQDAIRNLISIINMKRCDAELNNLRMENGILNKYIRLKDDEILFLRKELSLLNGGLSKLAENLMKRGDDMSETRNRVDKLTQETKDLAQEQTIIKADLEKRFSFPFNTSLLYFAIGLCVGMLLIYLLFLKIISP